MRMGRQADGAPGAFALAVAREIRREMGDRRLSGRGLGDVLGKSEKYVRERIAGTLSFALNDVEVFANYLGIDPEELIARIESNVPAPGETQDDYAAAASERTGEEETDEGFI